MDHLACFIPAMLALGAHSGAVVGQKADAYLALAGNLTYTCWQMYDRQATGAEPLSIPGCEDLCAAKLWFHPVATGYEMGSIAEVADIY